MLICWDICGAVTFQARLLEADAVKRLLVLLVLPPSRAHPESIFIEYRIHIYVCTRVCVCVFSCSCLATLAVCGCQGEAARKRMEGGVERSAEGEGRRAGWVMEGMGGDCLT